MIERCYKFYLQYCVSANLKMVINNPDKYLLQHYSKMEKLLHPKDNFE